MQEQTTNGSGGVSAFRPKMRRHNKQNLIVASMLHQAIQMSSGIRHEGSARSKSFELRAKSRDLPCLFMQVSMQ